MKTINQIAEDIKNKAEADAEAWWNKIGGEDNILAATKDELVVIMSRRVAAEKFNDIYDIVALLDIYLQISSPSEWIDEDRLRAEMVRKIGQL